MAVVLTKVDADDQGDTYYSVWGDGAFIYVACGGGGLHSYSVDESGNLTHVDTDMHGADGYNSVWGDGTFIYVACGGGGLHSYSVDESGNLTYVDTDHQSGNYMSVWGDGTFIYVTRGTYGLSSYSVDESGNLTYVDTDDQGGDYGGVWGDGTFIYVACGTYGLRSYSVDGAGALTHVDADDQGGAYYYVWGDGTYVYATCGDSGVRSHSVDGSGVLTYIDSDDQGSGYGQIWGSGGYIYVAGYSSGIRVLSANTGGTLRYETTSDQGDSYYSVWGDGTFIYLGMLNEGLWSYKTTINPSDKRYTRNIVTFCNNKVFYGTDPDDLAELTAADGDINCTIPLSACGAYGQVFVANHDSYRVLDFKNVKLTTGTIGANLPYHGDIVEGGTSGAQMVVDFITTSTGACVIYGNRITAATFANTETVTGTNKNGDAVSFTITANEVAGPHWYAWTPYGNDTTNFGEMPDYAGIVELHIGKLWLTADTSLPHQWYATRQNNPWDFLYAQNDAGSAVAGNNTDAGEVGDIIVDMISYSDDYAVFGCASKMHVLLGNPCAGGRIDLLRNSGLLAARAWTWDDDGNLYMLSTEGILVIPKGFGSADNLTKTNYPDFIDDLAYNPSIHRITFAYDRKNKGIFVTRIVVSTGASESWFLDLRSSGFFPESYPVECAAFCALDFDADDPADSYLLTGCKDGYLRKWDRTSKSDDAGASGDKAIDAYIGFGPMATSDSARKASRISGIDIVAGGDGDGGVGDSDDLYCKVYVNRNAQKVISDIVSGASPRYTKTYKSPGQRKGNVDRRKVFGKWVGLVIGNDTVDQSFAFEHMNFNGI